MNIIQNIRTRIDVWAINRAVALLVDEFDSLPIGSIDGISYALVIDPPTPLGDDAEVLGLDWDTDDAFSTVPLLTDAEAEVLGWEDADVGEARAMAEAAEIMRDEAFVRAWASDYTRPAEA